MKTKLRLNTRVMVIYEGPHQGRAGFLKETKDEAGRVRFFDDTEVWVALDRLRNAALDPHATDALENKSLVLPGCGCNVAGAGTSPDPVRIIFCAAHAAVEIPSE